MLQFNTLRNRFAHEPQSTITQKDGDDLYNGMGDHIRAAFHLHYNENLSPAGRVRRIGMIIVILLDRALEHLQDAKLFDIALMEEVKDVLKDSPVDREKYQKETDGRIRARFEELKKAQHKET